MLSGTIRDPAGGVNQSGLRDHNARLVLSLIQRHGGLSGVEIARRTGLSQQTVSVILRQLENEGFVKRGEPQRGRVGKPQIPLTLNPEGAFSVGLKVGRRTADLVLTDLEGRIIQDRQLTHPFPDPDQVFDFLAAGLAAFEAVLGPEKALRIAGIGVAAPFELWNWTEAIGAPAELMNRWRNHDFADQIATFSALPVTVENDATSACRAELVFGKGPQLGDFAHFFVGSFIGGGVVLNDSVYVGKTGNAGAFGTLQVFHKGQPRQLLDAASLVLLEQALNARGLPGANMWKPSQDWADFEPLLTDWIEGSAQAIAQAVVGVSSVIDFEHVLIDGSFPPRVRTRLVEAVRRHVTDLDSRGIRMPAIEEGTIGGNARALGAATGPIFRQFLLDKNAGLLPADPQRA